MQCVCVCVVIAGCVELVGNNGPHAFSIHSRPVGHRLRQEKSYDGAFLPPRAILFSFSYLSSKSFPVCGTIFIQNFHQSCSVSCFDKFTGSLALTRKNWGTRGDIWSHITLRWMGWNWVWYIFEPILLYNALVWVGFERYLRPHYYTMDRLELGLIYIRTLASPVHVGTFEPCTAKICSSSNPSLLTQKPDIQQKRILTNQDDNSDNHFNIIERLPLVFR